jgi:hypothetical protein
MSWVAAGVASAQLTYGVYKKIKSDKAKKALVKPKNPTYDIPTAANDALANAQTAAGQTEMPGQRLMEQKLGAQTASGMRAMTEGAGSSAGLMAGIGAIRGNQMAGQADINQSAMSYQDLNKQRLQSALSEYGNYQDKAFQYNKIAPFQTAQNQYNLEYNSAEAEGGAAAQNIWGGANSAANAYNISQGGKRDAGGVGGGQVIDPKTGRPITPQKPGLNFQNQMKEGGLVGKYSSARRKGFKGNYKDWMVQQGSTYMQDFNFK